MDILKCQNDMKVNSLTSRGIIIVILMVTINSNVLGDD